MFTGIIEGYGTVFKIKKENCFITYTIKVPIFLSKKLKLGASIANNGCCLTITDINNLFVSFDIIKESLDKTNLKYLQVNDLVNLERSLKIGNEIGGHLILGHISGIAKICNISINHKYTKIWIQIIDVILMKYIFYKGCICINGVSLTISTVLPNNLFCVYLIPETLSRTNFKTISLNQFVNIEIDYITQIVVDSIERLKLKNITDIKHNLFKSINKLISTFKNN
ncbi:riboflavin synthase alpha chain [Buchnera aphidicola (Nipponaphis monzeni)]|uniref:Riboflavin synthase n=1 Tax=Buchnera aphidicola (Nipponaphis monzeni) TaxID=2495405 RepID=A0A455T9V8_9GAMM|nr:riboflavin synthase subunit alpha [Buchnera aphidicola]BBI01109.1 riboflavin synthase alpha chain [Buchnera aphidicola (Nipponaphis monzeni)]